MTDSEYGKILVHEDGRTLYAFDKETTERSECFGACAEAWPPFYTDGEPQAGKGVDEFGGRWLVVNPSGAPIQ